MSTSEDTKLANQADSSDTVLSLEHSTEISRDTDAVPVLDTGEAVALNNIDNNLETIQKVTQEIIATNESADPSPLTSLQEDTPIPFINQVRRSGTNSIAFNSQISPAMRKRMLRYVRNVHRRRRQTEPSQAPSIILLAILLFGIMTPLALTAHYSINAYDTYNAVRTYTSSGIQHLLEVKTIFSANQPASSNTGSTLDPAKLKRAGVALNAAHADFGQVKKRLEQSDLLNLAPQILPQSQSLVATAFAASQIGIDIASAGQQLITAGQALAPSLHGSLLSEGTTPLITPATMALFHTTLDHLQPVMDDIQLQAGKISLDALPLSQHQLDQFKQYLQLLPQIETAFRIVHTMIDPIAWLLGVDQPRTFLIQTLDRGELRPSGGFTGQYGELHITGGRVAPFSLQNISLLEYSAASKTYGNQAPEAYRSWWPFANWGLRDSNLSADLPTSARLAIDRYEYETQQPVDGVIVFTPFIIEHVLQAIGPITINLYHETITSQNLEERLHFYQDSGEGMAREKEIEHIDDNQQARKIFTSRLEQAIVNHIRHAPTAELLQLGQQMFQDLQTRDLGIYFANNQFEDLLAHYNVASQLDRATSHDGLSIVQANVSVSKASQYVRTTVHDTVNLDTVGGATHIMQLRLAYTQAGDVYGFDTYRDYVRVYVPSSAQFRWGDGFDSGVALCGAALPACATDSIYPHDELVCPPGLYQGASASEMLNDPYLGEYHPLDQIGPPTNFQSDEPDKAMFGGYVVIPKNCTMTVTLSWYVPPMGQSAYSLLFQRQVGTFPELDLTVLPASGSCTGLYFNAVLANDASFTFNPPHTPTGKQSSCTSQLRV